VLQSDTQGFAQYRQAPIDLKGTVMKFATPLLGAAAATLLLVAQPSRAAVDVEAAKELARANNCFKCHSIEKKKDGPAWKEVAAKYKGKSDAEDRLYKHLTTGEKAKFPDGHEEEHKIIKAKDPAEIKNLVNFILTLQ
jgi:cytochrome c